jgi:hypothetical protein
VTIRDGSEGQQPVGEGIEELESRNEVMPPKSTDPASAVSGSTRPRPMPRTTSPDAVPTARLVLLSPASSFASKIGTSDLENRNIRFLQSIFTINIHHTFHHHTNIHEAQIRCIELKHMNKHKGLLELITSLNTNVHTLQIVLKSIGNKFDIKGYMCSVYQNWTIQFAKPDAPEFSDRTEQKAK